MKTNDIRKHYEAHVAKAADWQLIAMINRDVNCDKRIADVLSDLATDEAMRRGHAMPLLWALSAAATR